MTGKDLLQLAGVGLARNRLRTVLTALGVCVGVFALTTIVAIGGGLERSIKKELTDGEDPRRLIVRPGFGPMAEREAEIVGVDDPAKADRLRKAITKRRRGGPGQRKRIQLTLDTIAALSSHEHVERVRPLAIDRFKARLEDEAAAGGGDAPGKLGAEGEEPEEAGSVLDGAISYGIEPTEPRWRARVILGAQPTAGAEGVWVHEYMLYRWGLRSDAEQATAIGKTLVLTRPQEAGGLQALLATARASGLDVPVDPQAAEALLQGFAKRPGLAPFLQRAQGKEGPALVYRLPIAGVIRERIESDGFDLWEDSFSMQADLFLPQAFAEKLFAQVPSNVARGYNAAALHVDSLEHVREVEKDLKKQGYRIVSVGTILERVSQISALLTAVISGLTGIALIVAMLGIVNTMVMNVSERTKEIGVFKALGATDRQVLGLFLVESGLIGLFGGVAGVGLSLLSSLPGDAYVRAAIYELSHYHYDGTVFHFPAWLLVLALSFAVGLSVLAALGPARRASRIDPVRALREE